MGGRAPAEETIERLKSEYPGAKTALDWENPLELLVATILSAQTTDVRVNATTPALFERYPTPGALAAADPAELEALIHATGFFRQKARSIVGMAAAVVERFGGEVPNTMESMLQLPGVARKTANIVQANCYPEAMRKDPDAGIAVDTHVGRLAVRLGFTSFGSKEAEKIERDLMALAPRKQWPQVPYLLIEHGRAICLAKKPLCADCPVEPLCPSSQEAGRPDLYRR